jgi:hypothetical protein
LRTDGKWQTLPEERNLETGYAPAEVGEKSDQLTSPQGSHDPRRRAGLAAMNDTDAASQSMPIDQWVQPRIVALANYHHRGAPELGDGGCNRLERTEMCAHEDRAVASCERGVDAKKGFLRHVDQIERAHSRAAQQQAGHQILTGANEACFDQPVRFGRGQAVTNVVLGVAARRDQEPVRDATGYTSQREQKSRGNAIRQSQPETHELVQDEILRALDSAPTAPGSQVALVRA